MDEKLYWVWLSLIPGIGPIKSKQLLDQFINPQGLWEANINELQSLAFLKPVHIEAIVHKRYRNQAKMELERIYNTGTRVLTIHDNAYPDYLKNIYDPPVVLYVRGSLNHTEKSIAIVGSRKASSYGMMMAENLAMQLAMVGVTVVSGMARGIDSGAHSGALKAGGKTIAVLGCGPDIAYPPQNRELMDKILNSGAVISEYLPGVQPIPGHFPSRNRIISGISMGVLVIEAGEKSGSLITASFALEQGREVFALPGNITSQNSIGTNKLIKEGAKIVTGIKDIFDELNIEIINEMDGLPDRSAKQRRKIEGLDRDENRVIECLENGELHIDDISSHCGFSPQLASSLLIMLELKGIVNQFPGKIFSLKEY